MAEIRQYVPAETELKLIVRIEPIGELTADDYEFEIEAKAWRQKVVKFKKSETIRVDENSRIVVVDTGQVGYGDLKLRIVAQIPDSDLPDQYRKEVCILDTYVTIIEDDSWKCLA